MGGGRRGVGRVPSPSEAAYSKGLLGEEIEDTGEAGLARPSRAGGSEGVEVGSFFSACVWAKAGPPDETGRGGAAWSVLASHR